MPKNIRGPGYVLRYDDGGTLLARLVEYGVHDLGGRPEFEASLAFHQRAIREGVRGVLPITSPERDVDKNFLYPVAGFDTDLLQLVKGSIRPLEGAALLSILGQIVEALLNIRGKFWRTHGRLTLQSVLLRFADERTLAGAQASLTDFRPDPEGLVSGAIPGAYEVEDLRALGQFIICIAQGRQEVGKITRNDIPSEADPKGRQVFGRYWPECRKLSTDLISPLGGEGVKTLEDLQERLLDLGSPGGPKTRQTISFDPFPARISVGDSFVIGARASSGLPVSFVVASGRASLRYKEVKVTGPGNVTIKAVQAGNDEFRLAEESRSFSVARRSQVISFDPPGDRFFGDPPLTINASADSALPVELRVESGPAEIGGGAIALTGLGRVTICASQPGNDNFAPADEVRHSFEVRQPKVRRPQTVTFDPPGDKTFGNAPFLLSAEASSGLPITFSVVSGPAAINEGWVTMRGAGTVTIRAVQSGNEDVASAEAVQSFRVAKAPQTIRFVLPSAEITVGNTASCQAVASSGLRVNLRILRGSATIHGTELIADSAGPLEIKATQPGDDNYLPVESTQILTVALCSQTISFAPLPKEASVGEVIPARAEASSGLPVTLGVLSGPASLKGGKLVLRGKGEVKIQAAQAGDASFRAAADVVQTLNVVQARQTITFEDCPETVFVGESFAPRAKASSGLPVQITVVSGPSQAKGGLFVVTSPGRVELKGEQLGDENHQPAQATRSIEVVKKTQSIDFAEIENRTVRDPAFRLEARATSGLPVKFHVRSGAAALDGDKLTLLGAGPVEIAATQPGDETYEPAEEAVQSFRVTDPRRRRILILTSLLIGMLVGGLAVAGWWIRERKLQKDALNEVRGRIERNELQAALAALADPHIGQADREGISNALKAVPELSRPDQPLKVEQGKDMYNSFSLNLPANIVPIARMVTNLNWAVGLERKPARGVEVSNLPSRLRVGEQFKLKFSATAEAATGPAQIFLAISNSAENGARRVELQIVPPNKAPTFLSKVEPQVLQLGDPPRRIPLALKDDAPLSELRMDTTPDSPGKLNVTTSSTNGNWELLLTPKAVGEVTVTVTATDKKDEAARANFLVTIKAANKRPEFGSVAHPELEEGVKMSVSLKNLSDDEDEVDLTLQPSVVPPERLTVTPHFRDGEWELQLAPKSAGPVEVTLIATDKKNAPAKTHFNWMVEPAYRPPDVYAGTYQPVEWQGDGKLTTVSLGGSATNHRSSKYAGLWNLRWSGAAGVTIEPTNTATATATFTKNGRYELKLTATDGRTSITAVASVTVNQRPKVSAGATNVVEFKSGVADTRVNLTGSGSDDDLPNRQLEYTWTKLQGPGEVLFTASKSANTTASFARPGDYDLTLTVNDGHLSRTATNKTIINKPPDVKIVAKNGTVDVSEDLVLNSEVTDDDLPFGKSPTLEWEQDDQNGRVTFLNGKAEKQVKVRFPRKGDFTLRLTADDGHAKGRDTIKITVVDKAEEERTKLRHEVDAFRVWFGLAEGKKLPPIQNPTGYEKLGLSPKNQAVEFKPFAGGKKDGDEWKKKLAELMNECRKRRIFTNDGEQKKFSEKVIKEIHVLSNPVKI